MKKALLISFIIFSTSLLFGQGKDDNCPDFGKGNLSHLIKRNIKSPDGIIKICFSDLSSLGMSGSIYDEEEVYDSQGNLISKSSERGVGVKYFSGDYDGYSGAIGYEKKIKKKSTLQIEIGYTHFRKISFLDTDYFDYPTIDVTQYYSDFTTSQNGTLECWTEHYFDIVVSNNFSIACDYRFYLRKVFRKSYFSPFIKCYIGQNKYYDFDSNHNNINYGFKQTSLMLNLGIKYGYQWIIKKHYVINPSIGLAYLKGFETKRNYNNAEATDEGLIYKYPNTIALQNNYRMGYFFGLSIGYKFNSIDIKL